ncbi:carboxypeptidase-like regulatory domain-containing protein [Polaribacter sp. Q13]|uniref:TonB-dependent receptor n=1 Tax=Polaribacter sp. Q13 TaxID=2806551 RepID=UPI00193B764C|nr:carboxypeptidase-like regulatory domain-containing protein [Polaribacter sp. Q13]QVY64282.1 carboxypeptidase-like regulatory domain-containing protein [Polaribacter sp. Q13]
MRNFKNLLFVALLFVSATVLGQTKITGTVVDDTNQPLPGASVVVKGTTNGTSTDFDGKFTLKADAKSGSIVISFIGFTTKEVTFSASKSNLRKIKLVEDLGALDEIVVTATSFAIDRKTPVAVSTIKAADIEVKLGTQEFPEILKSTPGVYATKAGGGYGDSRINLRGFSSENVAVMINGVPVNDMENGAVYWSNWSGLADVTSAMQVQRGLGASKVAVPSIGGTINIISKSTDALKGGNVTMSTGNDGYQKYGMTVSTGLMDNGLAITASAAKVSGDGYVNGTQFSGVNYFLNVSKIINPNHKLSFNVIGAQQTHGQRYTTKTIAQNRATEQGGKRFNPDWGYRNGQVENNSYNFYNKPQISLNHDWTISDKTYVTTVVYASFGTGGGRRTEGSGKLTSDDYRLGDIDQPIDYDRIVQENKDRGALGSSDVFTASVNNHEWYGVLSTLKTNLTENLVLSAGLDGRYYVGTHYYEITDLLGGQFYQNPKSNDNNYNAPLQVGDRFNRDYEGRVLKYGTFAQLEYSKNDLSLFLSPSISNTRYGRSSFLDDSSNPNGNVSDNVNFLGFGTKGGANYNLDDTNNVFANIGYFSNAPFLTGGVFVDKESVDFNEDATNEKVFSAEIGYGYRSDKFSANVNLYRTSWLDKSIAPSIQDPDNVGQYLNTNITGLDALHQGVEIDFIYKFSDKLKLNGMLSLGDWTWQSDVQGDVLKDDGSLFKQIIVNAKDLKVNDAAQTTYALGLTYNALENSTVFLDYNYAGDIYANFDFSKGTEDRMNTWKLPSYHLFDLGFRHGFEIAGLDTTLSGKMNNIFDVEYISDAFDDKTYHSAETAKVYYGAGRTFSLGLKVKF